MEYVTLTRLLQDKGKKAKRPRTARKAQKTQQRHNSGFEERLFLNERDFSNVMPGLDMVPYKYIFRHSMKEHTGTQTIDSFDTWTDTSDSRDKERSFPRLKILYHINLERIGQVSSPDAFSQARPWLQIGRNTCIFVKQSGQLTTLEDPTISRQQFQIRWLAEEGVFEVEPIAGAKLELAQLPLQESQDTYALLPLHSRTRMPPGACLVVGNRLVLALECVRGYHEPQENRMGLIGESDCMWTLRKHIKEVASFSRPVLVLGPTGSGKELVSQAIHRESARQAQPFIVANCAALPDNIIESLLFGHKKGAFTGAESSHLGFFRTADQGTLFLDEIGELPLTLQPKLLRVIQDGHVRPVGAQQSKKVDVRLVAATNRNPEEEIREGRLREDLYHRLATYLLRVPPLGDRRLDIPELFISFLQRYSQEAPDSSWLWDRSHRWKKTIPLDWFIELLLADWSGNVRQLENVAARVIQSNLDGPPFNPPSLPITSKNKSSASLEAMPAVSPPQENDESSPRFQQACELLDLAHKTVRKLLEPAAIDDVYKSVHKETGNNDTSLLSEHLKQAATQQLLSLFEANGFSQRRVCKHLEISHTTLIKLMQRFGIPRPSDLTLEMIEATIAEVGEDLNAVARHLRVSSQGLRRQLTLLNLKKP